MNPILYFVIFIPLFIIFWCFVSFILSIFSGWISLAKYYKIDINTEKQTWHFVSGRIGFVNYRNCLILGSNTEGLYIRVLPIFRFGHPKLFIPWKEISMFDKKRIFSNYKEIVLEKTEGVKIKINFEIGDEILKSRNTWETIA